MKTYLLIVMTMLSSMLFLTPDLATAESADPLLDVILRSPVLERFGPDMARPVDDPHTIDELVAVGIRRNRALRAAAARVLAARELVPQAQALPDPRLAVVEYLQPVETRVGPQDRAYQFSQSFPWFGTLGAKGDIKREKAAAAQSRLDQKILELITRIRANGFELAYLDSSIGVTGSHLVLLSQWERTAQSRYASGSGGYAALIKTQVELGKLSNRLAELEDRRTPLLALLNADLDRSPDTPVRLTVLPAALAAEAMPDESRLTAAMAANNPLLSAWRHEAAAAVNSGKLAGKQGLPSFTLGVNLIQTGPARMSDVADSGKNALMATVGIQVPLWRGKYSAASREAANRLAAADDSRRQESNTLAAGLSKALFRYRDARRQFELYDTALIPKARQSLDAARAAFEAGKGNYLDLIDAQRLLLEFQLAAVRAHTDLLIQRAMIEQLIAAPLSTSPATQS